ncbi:MAG: hypothetical protein M3Q30_07725 [Actinomycetota bacterium]|nr:hypothetical protein [Actinomycetota bacterium]
MAILEKCDLKSCGVGFDADGPNAVSMETTVDGGHVALNFCSHDHLVEWATEEQKRRGLRA